MVIASRTKKRAVFIYGLFEKRTGNIGSSELATLREIATTWLSANAERIDLGVTEDELQEIPYGHQKT